METKKICEDDYTILAISRATIMIDDAINKIDQANSCKEALAAVKDETELHRAITKEIPEFSMFMRLKLESNDYNNLVY